MFFLNLLQYLVQMFHLNILKIHVEHLDCQRQEVLKKKQLININKKLFKP